MFEQMKVAIFDMDGTLIDSMGEWRRLNQEFVRQQGITPTPEQDADLYSMSGVMVVDYFRDAFGLETDFDTLCRMAVSEMEKIYERGVPLMPGAMEYLRRLHARGVQIVIATATPARPALLALNRMGLTPLMDRIYSVDMIGGEKSDIDFYDRLCERLGVTRADCVMFEDSLYAMEGAKRAELLGVVGIRNGTNTRDRAAMETVCDVVIDSFDELE